jgi:hypothetical protein
MACHQNSEADRELVRLAEQFAGALLAKTQGKRVIVARCE